MEKNDDGGNKVSPIQVSVISIIFIGVVIIFIRREQSIYRANFIYCYISTT